MFDIHRDIFLSFMRVHILHHASEVPIYGLEMIQELARHGYSVSPGTLYPVFHSLERSGLLISNKQVIQGKSRRYYEITELGRQTLITLKPKLLELFDEVINVEHDVQETKCKS